MFTKTNIKALNITNGVNEHRRMCSNPKRAALRFEFSHIKGRGGLMF